MTIYLLKGYLDVAATSLTDAQALLTALTSSDPTSAANLKTISRILDKLEALVQSDSGEPLVLSSIDDTSGTISSWVTDAGTTLAVGLGDQDPATASAYASTSSFSISGNTRVGTLALNTTALCDALRNRLTGRQSFAGFALHLQKTSGGVTKTVGLLRVQVGAGVLSSELSTGAVTPSFAAGAVIPIPGITSLTGGGTTALDGLVTASSRIPTGATVLLSYGRVGQFWQLIAGTDAEAVSNGIVRPDDYHASTNARIWVQL